MFSIAPPVTLTDTDGDPDGTEATLTSAVGHCATDTFAATGSPVICGVNTGQHMVLDTDGTQCVQLVFTYGGDTATRDYNIHVTQFDERNEMGGPKGCLQYFTGNTGTFSSFNFQTDATATGGNIGSPHLANQDYTVCIRPNADRCAICYAATISYTTITVTNTFGLSNPTTMTQVAEDGATCTTDYIFIPNGLTSTIAGTSYTAAMLTALVSNNVAAGVGRYCGRLLGLTQATVSHTVCSRVTPFTVGVFFDGTEVFGTAAAAMQDTNEASVISNSVSGAAGTYGFSLGFDQRACS